MSYVKQEYLGQGTFLKLYLFFKALRCLVEAHLLMPIRQVRAQ